MAQIIKTTFQFRRGKASSWKKNNPVLAVAEPGYETDTGMVKYGDGITPWNDLPYFKGEAANSIYCVTNYEDLPLSGKSDIVYKVETEQKLYQWNSISEKYESLSGGGSEIKIEQINGGNAKWQN